MSTLNQALARRGEDVLETERRRGRIMQRWLRGYTIDQIRDWEGLESNYQVVKDLNIKRKELREQQDIDILDLAAERIEGLRVIQADCRHYMGFFPERSPQFLTIILRAEESTAKIQGVLNEKVLHLGRIQHHVKLYDFRDNFPPSTVEGEAIVIEEPELEELPSHIIQSGKVNSTLVPVEALPIPEIPDHISRLRIITL